jgi:hypothetical protein
MDYDRGCHVRKARFGYEHADLEMFKSRLRSCGKAKRTQHLIVCIIHIALYEIY